MDWARTCAWCGAATSGRMYCSGACNQAMFRSRHPGYLTPDQDRTYKARYRANHPEVARSYYEQNKARYAERAEAWYRQNTGRARENGQRYHREHPEAARKKKYRRRALEAAADCRVLESDWQKLVRRYGGKCAYCQMQDWAHRDHVVPLSRGGRHGIGNLLPACQSCNLRKGSKFLAEWRR